MREIYDAIGDRYSEFRRPDPRIADVILRGLGDAESVVNVGAGTGSYEPRDRRVVAVEPSSTMIRQRPRTAAPAIRAVCGALPLRDAAVDAALAILTLHHWPDVAQGVRELCRVARRRVVILTWDPQFPGFWLTDYFPQILEIDRSIFPSIDRLCSLLGNAQVISAPIPRDCSDGFLGAYWRRPERYLDPAARSAISTFSKLTAVGEGVARLTRHLSTGTWKRRHGAVLGEEALDVGYRLLVADRAAGRS